MGGKISHRAAVVVFTWISRRLARYASVWLLIGSSVLLSACGGQPAISEALIDQIAVQLPDGATLLLPTITSSTAIHAINLEEVDEAALRPLLQEVVSLYLLFEPSRMALYEETAVSNITWIENHSELVELTRYEDGHILYWVVVTQGRTFNTHPLRVVPGG